MTTELTPPPEDEEIDLLQLFHTLWLQRVVIASIATAGALFGGLAGQFSTKYVSEGVVLTGDVINASSYKRYESILRNGSNLEKFLERSPQLNKDAASVILGVSESPSSMQELIKPEFVLTAKDQKLFGINNASENSGNMIGIRVKFEGNVPSLGAPIVVLGDYVRDAVLRLNVESGITENCLKNQAFAQSMRIEKIKGEFAIKQEQARAKTLRSLKSTGGVSQLISIEKGGERFLSPQAQLNAVEITISELVLEQVTRDNDVNISEIRKAYYCKATQTLEKPINIGAVLAEMKILQGSIFKDLDSSKPFVVQVANEFELERDGWESGYLRGMRFISAPENAEVKVRKLGIAMGLLLGAMLGGLLGIIFAFARKWWQSHQSEITKP
jgi:LPS O-antigen subunit length determinant protein (WzzB/FepE family)